MIAQGAEEFVSTDTNVTYGLDLQEADIHRRIHELVDNLGSSLIEVSQGDCWYFGCLGHGDRMMGQETGGTWDRARWSPI
jgi:hypothetical protein